MTHIDGQQERRHLSSVLCASRECSGAFPCATSVPAVDFANKQPNNQGLMMNLTISNACIQGDSFSTTPVRFILVLLAFDLLVQIECLDGD